MFWQIALAISIISASLATLAQKVLLREREVDPVASAIFLQVFFALLIGLFGVVTGQFTFNGISQIISNLIVLMLLIGGFYAVAFRAIKLIEISKYIVILSLRPVFTVISSTLFLSEGLNNKQYLGMALILAAVALVTLERNWKFNFGKGEIMALAAAALVGFANTNDRIALLHFSFITYLFLSALLPGTFLVISSRNTLKKMKIFLEKNLFFKVSVMSFFQSLAVITFLLALKAGNNSSQVSSINEVSIILTVILSIIFLKERDFLDRKLSGALLAFLGLILMG
ncbi:MAG: DMT family transporter [Patescibacteria group bacterium]|nr:DMT family transporter [Patescibacteria group bacterium]